LALNSRMVLRFVNSLRESHRLLWRNPIAHIKLLHKMISGFATSSETVGEKRAKPFSLSADSLFFDLRMTSIIIIMKLGRDSESIASYRTFHNQASERPPPSNSNRFKRKQISRSVHPFICALNLLEGRYLERMVFSGNRRRN